MSIETNLNGARLWCAYILSLHIQGGVVPFE